MLKQAKVQYYANEIQSSQGDQKQLFNITKMLVGESKEVILPTSESPKNLAQSFSDFFVDKIEQSRTDIGKSDMSEESNNDEFEKHFEGEKLSVFGPSSESEVKSIIQKSPNKSCELDPIPTWLLKNCIDELSPILTRLFNISLENAYVPLDLKSAIVRPLIKKPGLDKNVYKNYRPVSNLPFISKVLEKVVDKRIETHLNIHSLHEPQQSAYKKFHSTETALVRVQNDILQALDNNENTVLLMLDLSAAFDTIDHQKLLSRLENHFGITGTPLKWMNSYLNERYQTVSIDGELSKPVRMTYSVPQGSVLGPKNYILYTKPVGAICKKHGLNHHFYADDSQLYMTFKPKDLNSKQKALQNIESCLIDIVQWMNTNLLKLNAEKTEVILAVYAKTK